MGRLIELGFAIDTAIDAADEYDGGYNFERDRKIRDALMALPTVDAVPVRHGRWMQAPHKRARFCSCCYSDEPYKFADDDANVFDFCPHCGAKMDGKDGGNG